MSVDVVHTVESASGAITFEVRFEADLFTVYQIQEGFEPAEHQSFTDRDKAQALADQLADFT